MTIGFLGMVTFSYKHGILSFPNPAESKDDYVPVFYVSAASIFMFYAFLFNQTMTVFLEFSRLMKEYKEKKREVKPSFSELKYGTDNMKVLAANRCAGNFLEQLIPFIVALYAHATFVSVTGAVIHGWVWIFFRSYYLLVFQKPFPWIFSSTLPAYTCIWSMLASTAYTIASKN